MINNLVWSDSLEEFVVQSFTYNGHYYLWNDDYAVYYDETADDESFLFDVPFEELLD